MTNQQSLISFNRFLRWCDHFRTKGFPGIFVSFKPHIAEAVGTRTWIYPLWVKYHPPANDNKATS